MFFHKYSKTGLQLTWKVWERRNRSHRDPLRLLGGKKKKSLHGEGGIQVWDEENTEWTCSKLPYKSPVRADVVT